MLCYNEIGVFSEPASRYVLNCPHCGGMKIKAFPKGKIKRYQMPDDDPSEPIVNRWLRAAFANGEFVPVAMHGEIPPATARVPMNGEGQTCDIIKRSPDFKDEVLGKLSPLSAATILDAVFVARREISRDSRISDRVSTCVKLLAGNIDPAKVKVAESPDGDGVVYDILDTARRPTPPVKPSRLVPPAKSAALLRDQKLNEMLSPLYDWAGMIGRYVEKLALLSADSLDAAPGPHAQTHMAGTDSVFGTQEPSAITLGEHGGATGDRALGAAPINHIHDDTALAALAGLEFDAFGAVVADTQARRLLELLWLELLAIEDMLRSRRDRVR